MGLWNKIKKGIRYAIAIFSSYALQKFDVILTKDDPRYKSYKNKVKNDYYGLYKSIRDKYDLSIDNSTLLYQAELYAAAKADEKYTRLESLFSFENIVKITIGVILTVAGIVLSPFTFGASGALTWVGWTMIGLAVVGLVTTQVMLLNADNLAKAKLLLNALQSSTNQAINLQSKAYENANAQITQLLIFNPYAIFPEGAIYKETNAGSLTYRAGLEAPNPMRGINGEVRANPLSENINNTSHKDKPGNIEYDMLKNPFPTAKAGINEKLCVEAQIATIRGLCAKVQNGYSQLANDYFGSFDNALFFRHFDNDIVKKVNPLIQRMNDFFFLSENSYYKHAIRLPTKWTRFPLHKEIKYNYPISDYKYRSLTSVLIFNDEKHLYEYEKGQAQAKEKYIQESTEDRNELRKTFINDGLIAYINTNGIVAYATYIADRYNKAIIDNEDEKELHKFDLIPKAQGEYAIFYKRQIQTLDSDLEIYHKLTNIYDEALNNKKMLERFWESYEVELIGTCKAQSDILLKAQELANKYKLDFKDVFFCYELPRLENIYTDEANLLRQKNVLFFALTNAEIYL